MDNDGTYNIKTESLAELRRRLAALRAEEQRVVAEARRGD